MSTRQKLYFILVFLFYLAGFLTMSLGGTFILVGVIIITLATGAFLYLADWGA